MSLTSLTQLCSAQVQYNDPGAFHQWVCDELKSSPWWLPHRPYVVMCRHNAGHLGVSDNYNTNQTNVSTLFKYLVSYIHVQNIFNVIKVDCGYLRSG